MEPESSILKDYAVIPLQPPIVSWTLPYVKNKDVQLPTLFSLYLKPSSLFPSPPPPFSKGETSQHPPAGRFFWNEERVLPVPWAVSIVGSTREALTEMCCIPLNPPPPEKKEKEMVHYRRPCDGLFQSCRQQVTHVSHPSSATGREVFDWILDQGYYSERDTSNVMRQVLEAVAYLHSLKIVHRNLKVNGCTDT